MLAVLPPDTAGAGVFCLSWGISALLDKIFTGGEAWQLFAQLGILTLFFSCVASVPWSVCLSGAESCRKSRRKLRGLSSRALRLAAAAAAAGGMLLIALAGPGYGLLFPDETGGFPGEAAVCAVSVLFLTAGGSQAGLLFRLGKGILAAAAAVMALAVHGAGLGILVRAAGLGFWGAAGAHALSSVCFFLLCRLGTGLVLGAGEKERQTQKMR